jgi:V/A-type H+-transporting ATPase subunit K
MDTMWIAIGAALAIVGSALATAWAQSKIGSAAAATLAEKPELRTTAVLLVAIPETMVILGFVVAVLIVLRGG